MMKQLLTGFLLLLLHTTYGQQLSVAELRQQLAQARHDTVRLRLYGELGRLYTLKDIPTDTAYQFISKGLTLARQYKLTLVESRLHLFLGYYYKRRKEYVKAQQAYQTALRLGKSTGATALNCKLLYKLACVYGDQGMYQKTIETALSSLQVAQQLKDSLQMVSAYQLLCAAHIDVNNIPTALGYAEKNYQLVRKLVAGHPDRSSELIAAESSFVDIYEATGQHAKAYSYLKKAFDYQVAIRDETQISQAGIAVVRNLINQQRPHEALAFLEQNIQRKYITADGANVFSMYSQIHRQLDNANLALTFARKAYEKALTEGHLQRKKATLSALADLEESQKLYASALTHLRQLKIIDDSLFTIDKSKAIADVETRYEVTQKEQTIALLQKETALKQIRLARSQEEVTISRQRQFLLGLVVLVLLLCLIVLFTSRQRERRLGRMLTAQKADIEDKVNQLQQLNKLKDRLFAIIGHDLRSPIVSLRTQLKRLKEGYTSPDQFMQQSNRLMRVVDSVYFTLDNLLNWATVQRGGIRPFPVDFDLADLAGDALQLYEADIDAKYLAVSTRYDGAPVKADENQIQIVVRNLLHNAIKFTPIGGNIRIETCYHDGKAWLTIRDSGVGMDLNRDQISEGRVLSSRGTADETGTGLGLMLCHELLKPNNGSLHFDSAPGQGTTVSLSLPLAVETALPALATRSGAQFRTNRS